MYFICILCLYNNFSDNNLKNTTCVHVKLLKL